MITGESQFHISTSLGIEPGSLMMGSNPVDHKTSGTVYESGSPQTYAQEAKYFSCGGTCKVQATILSFKGEKIPLIPTVYVKSADRLTVKYGHSDQSSFLVH